MIDIIVSERDVSRNELKVIYNRFKQIEMRDGIPTCEQDRNQTVADENGLLIGCTSGLTNHKWFFLTDLWVCQDHRRQGLGSRLLRLLETKSNQPALRISTHGRPEPGQRQVL